MLRGNQKQTSGTTVEVPSEAHTRVLGFFQRIREAGYHPPSIRSFVIQAIQNEIVREEKRYGKRLPA